jgi:apolipoprotein N-acyltransferase
MESSHAERAPLTAERVLPWVWLAVGALLLPFTAWRTAAALASWAAPVFLLRFGRSSGTRRLTLPLLGAVLAAGILAGTRGTPFNLLGLFGNVIFKALAWTLPYAADRHLGRRLTGWARTLVFPVAFTVVDWGLSLAGVSNSGSPAYSQTSMPELLQMASLTGMWGLTFLVAWFAALINALWEGRFRVRQLRSQALVFAGVLAALLVFGVLRLDWNRPASPVVEAAAVTVDPELTADALRGFDWLGFSGASAEARAATRPRLQAAVDQMVGRTQAALDGGALIVAWQESSAWVLEEDLPDLLSRVAVLATAHHAYVNVGVEVLTVARTRHYVKNESILVDPEGRVLWAYPKVHPVPYGEALVTMAGQARVPCTVTRWGVLSTAICYDTYFPGLIRGAGVGKAGLLIDPTNDTRPFAESALAIAAVRAVENGLTILRPTGGGISAVIDDRGRILSRQSSFDDDSGVMRARVPIRHVATLYTRIGDLFAWLCAAGLVSLVVLGLVGRAPVVPVGDERRDRRE